MPKYIVVDDLNQWLATGKTIDGALERARESLVRGDFSMPYELFVYEAKEVKVANARYLTTQK